MKYFFKSELHLLSGGKTLSSELQFCSETKMNLQYVQTMTETVEEGYPLNNLHTFNFWVVDWKRRWEGEW